ncbi:MAG: hypothetical protein ACOH5I_05190 [Oligoflexus sp.]
MEFFRHIYRSQIAFDLLPNFWLQRSWLNHLPKKLDWPSVLATLARFAHHHNSWQNYLRFGWSHFVEGMDIEQRNERFETLISDFQRFDQLRSEDEKALLGGLSTDTPNTLIYAGHSPVRPSERRLDPSELELIEYLLPDLIDESRLHQQTIAFRNQWQVDDLVFQDKTGHFYSFRPEKQTLRAIRKGKRQDDSVHFGAFSLTIDRFSSSSANIKMEYGTLQFQASQSINMDMITAVARQLTELWQHLVAGDRTQAPHMMIEGDDRFANRLLVTELLRMGLSHLDLVAAPALVFGSYPLVSLAEFIAWPTGPRVYICFKPQQGIFSYAMAYEVRI